MSLTFGLPTDQPRFRRAGHANGPSSDRELRTSRGLRRGHPTSATCVFPIRFPCFPVLSHVVQMSGPLLHQHSLRCTLAPDLIWGSQGLRLKTIHDGPTPPSPSLPLPPFPPSPPPPSYHPSVLPPGPHQNENVQTFVDSRPSWAHSSGGTSRHHQDRPLVSPWAR